ncbi:MAG: hypothetical protein QNK05_25760 [Myxococcota bacterium]|nr:hypothetical protein [Myxococcota bacterium]
MAWKDLDFKERWSLVAATIQATATLGAFAVALVGIWRVAPIITYQVEKQKADPVSVGLAPISGSPLARRFARQTLEWWNPRVADYARIVELIRTREDEGVEVDYELIPGRPDGGQGSADLLVVASRRPGEEEEEVLRIEVNARALRLGHFVQREINRGFFQDLEPEVRKRVEVAVEHYAKTHVLPQIPPLHIREGMSLDQIAEEISHHQDDRVTAARQIPALVEIIEGAIRG